MVVSMEGPRTDNAGWGLTSILESNWLFIFCELKLCDIYELPI